jgi:type IV pilus secretin PilQ/predicted competence protein
MGNGPFTMYRRTTVVLLCLVMAVGAKASLTASAARIETATLKTIASRVDDRAGVITIEASAPVAYVAAQPDPQTFVIELRDVVASGFADNFSRDPRHPFAAVEVDSGVAPDGVAVARVSMALTQPLRPRVRSSRNVIYVEADRLDRTARPAGVRTIGPASALLHVGAVPRGPATAVTLYGSGRLSASRVELPKDGAPRLILDLPNATSALPRTTSVGEGPVDEVNIGLNSTTPFATQVVMNLTRRAPYRIETSKDGHELTVVFDPPSPTDEPTSASARQAPPSPTDEPTSTSAARAPLSGPAPPSPSEELVNAFSTTSQVPLRLQAAAAPQGAQPPAAAPVAQAPQPASAGAQASAAPQAAAQTPQPGASQKFTGFPISLDFQGADLRAVLRTFAEISGLNIVIDPAIQGTVDVALRDVPWDQALDIILRANRLGYSVDGTIVRIAPLNVLADEEAQRQKLAEAQALAGQLQTLTRTLSYARAEQVQPLITTTVLSRRGSITTDPRTNTLIITDLPERLTQAGELITTLDRPEPQVEIEARIVQTNRDFAQRIGVQWGFGARASTDLSNTLPFGFPNQANVGGRTGGGTGGLQPGEQRQQGPTPADATSTVVNLGVTGATSGVGLALGAINGALNLDVVLSALEQSGQGRILSTPRVTTQNNIEAQITQGIQIPIQTVANNTVTVSFRDAALTLLVQPQITAANTVIMRITVENASPDFSRSVNGIPPIDTQRALTQVLVSDGETTVIGGIYVSREQTIQGRTPGLYRIPLLGWLFQRNEIADESRELLIFITPRIARL